MHLQNVNNTWITSLMESKGWVSNDRYDVFINKFKKTFYKHVTQKQ